MLSSLSSGLNGSLESREGEIDNGLQHGLKQARVITGKGRPWKGPTAGEAEMQTTSFSKHLSVELFSLFDCSASPFLESGDLSNLEHEAQTGQIRQAASHDTRSLVHGLKPHFLYGAVAGRDRCSSHKMQKALICSRCLRTLRQRIGSEVKYRQPLLQCSADEMLGSLRSFPLWRRGSHDISPTRLPNGSK